MSSDRLQGRGAPIRSDDAFVTLVTNADYVKGAVALLHSLDRTGTAADLVVMHTPSLDAAALSPLKGTRARLIEVDHLPLSDEFNARHDRAKLHAQAPFTKGEKPVFHTPLDNFCKLHLWRLEDYLRVVFIDADALVLKNVDRLFGYPEFSAAANVYESLTDFQRLNSGVFAARPSLATFEAMLKKLDEPDRFWKRTDQTFLQEFFPDWHGLPVFDNMLQYVWLNLPELWDWNSINILHFQYEKPWDKNHGKAQQLEPLIALWRCFYDDRDIPDIAGLPAPPAAGAKTA